VSFEGTLLFALNAVSLTLVFFSHYDPPIAALCRLGFSQRARAYKPTIPPNTLTSGDFTLILKLLCG
jgi:hypothetical protein